MRGSRDVDRRCGVAGVNRRVAGVRQLRLHQAPEIIIVIDDQDPSRLVPRRILIVDDDDDFRGLMKTQLSDAGYPAVDARDAASAIHIARTAHPDVITVDLLTRMMTARRASCRDGS